MAASRAHLGRKNRMRGMSRACFVRWELSSSVTAFTTDQIDEATAVRGETGGDARRKHNILANGSGAMTFAHHALARRGHGTLSNDPFGRRCHHAPADQSLTEGIIYLTSTQGA